MELDATTFVLEIVNFLVLLWLLTRFLFKPIRSALAAREQAALSQAQALESARTALDAKAAELDRLRAALDEQRQAAERDLADELAAQRQKQLSDLNRQLDSEREKALAVLKQEQIKAREQSDRELRQQAATFVADYLKKLASPALEAAVMELFLAQLAEQSEQARAALRDGWVQRQEGAPTVDVATAYAAPAALRERIEAQVSALMGQPARAQWYVEPALFAGICIHLPGHQLEASLRRGVDAFTAETT